MAKSTNALYNILSFGNKDHKNIETNPEAKKIDQAIEKFVDNISKQTEEIQKDNFSTPQRIADFLTKETPNLIKELNADNKREVVEQAMIGYLEANFPNIEERHVKKGMYQALQEQQQQELSAETSKGPGTSLSSSQIKAQHSKTLPEIPSETKIQNDVTQDKKQNTEKKPEAPNQGTISVESEAISSPENKTVVSHDLTSSYPQKNRLEGLRETAKKIGDAIEPGYAERKPAGKIAKEAVTRGAKKAWKETKKIFHR